MTMDDMINIKLEVCRDKTSGKLLIMAHFDEKAPNVSKDKNSYFWMPTEREKDLIDEAFELMPIDADYSPPNKTIPKPEEKKLTTEIQPKDDEKKPIDMLPLEKPDESAIFEVTDGDIKTEDLDNIADKKIEDASTKVDKQTTEEPTSNELETEKKEEADRIIVEADSDAIEAALKKHTDNNDGNSMVEADEQTIVDKVLSQKKKGKWGRH